MRADMTPQDKEGLVEKASVNGGNPSVMPSDNKKSDSDWKKYLPYAIGLAIVAIMLFLIF